MNEVKDLKDILDYIHIGITNKYNDKDIYRFHSSMILDIFMNSKGIDFGIRYNILKLTNLMITKLAINENSELRDQYILLRKLIIPDLIINKEIDDDDRYCTS